MHRQIMMRMALGMVLLALEAQGEEVARDFCAFVDLGQAALHSAKAGDSQSVPGLGAGIRSVGGVTFDMRGNGLSLKDGDRVVFPSKQFVYAGEQEIESMMHRDMGPLVLYSVQSVYLLHGITGNTAERRVARLEFNYEDGTTVSEDLVLGENIGSPGVAAQWATMVTNGFCITSILNPVPYQDATHETGKGHGLKSLTISMTNRDVIYRIAAITCKLGRQKVHD